MSDQLELEVTEPQIQGNTIQIWDWKTIGSQENFTIVGMGEDNKMYYWKNQTWNLL